VRKAKNGRVTSIFTENDTTNNESHLYSFPTLAETRKIVLWGQGRVDPDYWEGGAVSWEAHPDSGHFSGRDNVAPPEGKIIPMRGGKREN
jgi:hypothetical protein